jgi:hypothetical protein
MDLDLSHEWDDNLGDVISMRFTSHDQGAYDRFAQFLNRRDVCLNDKIRAWNHIYAKLGKLDRLITSPDKIALLAREFPSDC